MNIAEKWWRLLASVRAKDRSEAKPENLPPDFEKTYASEVHRLLLERTRISILAGMVLYGSFWILDLVTAPELSGLFLQIRLGVLALAGITVWLTYTESGERSLVLLSSGVIWVASIGISMMTVFLGGFQSGYYAGNLMVLFMVGLFMPWSVAVTALFCLALMAGYFGLNLLFFRPGPEVVAPAFFLAGTAVFTCYSAVVSDRFRRRDLVLRFRLEKANEDLTRIDEAKTRFFSNVSHELRTPLTLMLGPVESLLREEKEESRETLLRSVLSNSRRLLRQVNLLLDTAKLESGNLVLDAAPDDLSEVLAELVSASQPHAERRGLRIETEGLEEEVRTAFDRDKVEMIAANLLSNAIKFTPRGGSIVVRIEKSAYDVSFEVEDTGPGIPEDQREKIFNRFHQLDTSLSREEGTGLGLSLARELARLHGGDLTVTSRPGHGSVFKAVIPVELPEQHGERRHRSRRKEDRIALARAEVLTAREFEERSKQDTLLADLRKPRLAEALNQETEGPEDAPLVLIVDDNDDLRAFLKRQLSTQYRVETAPDGVEGLEIARKTRPSLIVLDVMMPRMDGYETCRHLKQDAGLAAIPVILVTAKAGPEAIVEGLEIGADDYVTKPFSTEELEARIAAHLRAKETERELHEKESRLAAIGQLTSGVVHDLRNALMLIQGYSDLARSTAMGGGSTEDLVRDLDEIKGATQRLQGMSTEILDFARGGSELSRRSLPAKAYLSSALGGLVNHLEGQGISVDCELDLEEGEVVSLDGDRFQRVLENLVFNARDALLEHGGERRVLIGAGRRAGKLEIRVADTGPGIAPEIAGRLFEPFASKKKKGTGLGLPTVRNLVKAHGGEVRVEPKAPEGGAAFTVVVPFSAKPDIRGLPRQGELAG